MIKKILISSLTIGVLLGIPMAQGLPIQNPIIEVQAKAKVKLNVTKKTIDKGKTYTLKVSGTSKKVKWSSSNKSVATVSSKGKVTAKKAGTATISAKVDGKTLKCKITVKNPIKINATSKTLYKGNTYTLKVSGTSKKVTWSSSNKSVATVSSKGKVTAKKAGTTTISAKVSGKTLKCKITVKNPITRQKIVVIDAGHQAKGNNAKEPIGPGAKEKKAKVTTGTTGKWTKKKESEINLAVAKKLRKELEKRGYKVIMVRTKQNVNISNKERADIANKAKADVFIRLHCDGSNNKRVNGAHTIAPTSKNKYVPKKAKSSSQKLAQSIISSFCKKTKAKNRKVSYRDDMSGINWCKVPVTIIEMGFMSNKDEDKKLATSAYQTKCASGIADGIDNYFKK